MQAFCMWRWDSSFLQFNTWKCEQSFEARFSSLYKYQEDLVLGTWLIWAPSIFREGEWTNDLSLCREPINMNSVLDLLSLSLLAVSHSLTLARSLLTASVKWVSSAYIRGCESERQFGRSFMKRRKRSGPRIVLWGIPQDNTQLLPGKRAT